MLYRHSLEWFNGLGGTSIKHLRAQLGAPHRLSPRCCLSDRGSRLLSAAAPLSDHQNPALWLEWALPGGSGGVGQGSHLNTLCPLEQAIPQDGPGKLPGAETQPPGPAPRALSGQCPGGDSASRPRGGGGAGHRTTHDRLPGSLPKHQGWQARPPPAHGAASCCLLHLLSGQPGSDTWSNIRCTTGRRAHSPAPLSLKLGQGRKGAPSPSDTVPPTGHSLLLILELPADRKRLVL